jgi:hypothetical protein
MYPDVSEPPATAPTLAAIINVNNASAKMLVAERTKSNDSLFLGAVGDESKVGTSKLYHDNR